MISHEGWITREYERNCARQSSPFDRSEMLLSHLDLYSIASHEHGIHFTRSMQADKNIGLLFHRHAFEQVFSKGVGAALDARPSRSFQAFRPVAGGRIVALINDLL